MKHKRGFLLFTAMFLMLVVYGIQAQTVTARADTYDTVVSTSAKAARRGLVKENGHYHYYKSNGKLLKNSWKRINGRVYYFKANGNAATYSCKVKNYYYVFDSRGRRFAPKKNALRHVGRYTYYVTPNGGAIKGWHIINGNLYYVYKWGRCAADTTYDGITFSKSGAAKSSTATTLKMKTMSIVASITNGNMSSSQKLRACWSYVTGGHFHYAGKYPNLNSAGWQRSLALDILQSGSGNCYGFACAFAALAREVGYSPVMVCGRVPGSRDGASDGYTRHCWVKINGAHYDPEAQYAGWCRGIYGYSYYPMSHQIQRYVNF